MQSLIIARDTVIAAKTSPAGAEGVFFIPMLLPVTF